MARYKEYKKGDNLGSIRMFGYQDSNNMLFFKYEAWLNVGTDDLYKVRFDEKSKAERFMKRMGYKEY